MVSDVAAMFVATTTFLTDGLGGSNTLFCNSEKKKQNFFSHAGETDPYIIVSVSYRQKSLVFSGVETAE